ncbi:unnamed protein product, partial [marine sediment metagenome]
WQELRPIIPTTNLNNQEIKQAVKYFIYDEY